MDKINLGRRGEECAAKYLIASGYQIIARNLHLGNKELDIIACKKGWLYFFEIKTRSAKKMITTDSFITRRQLAHLKKAALSYAANLMTTPEKISFDLIVIYADINTSQAQIKHYHNIF